MLLVCVENAINYFACTKGLIDMKHSLFAFTLFACVAVAVTAVTAQEGHWNQFRGPNGDGKSAATDLPVEFSETNNLRWKIPIHDNGWSSPVVWGNQIWMTTARVDGSELFAVCVDLETGDIIHDIKVFDNSEAQLDWNELNSHATPTPVVEEGRVYVHYGTYGTACLDTKTGKKLWERRDLHCDHRVRPGSSPIIDGDLLFLNYDGVDVQFAATLDKRTGETRWLKPRGIESDHVATLMAIGLDQAAAEKQEKDLPNDHRKAFATSTVIRHEGRRQLISPGAEVTFSYDPETGEELWRASHPHMGFNTACRPIFDHGLLYITTGHAKQVLAIDPSGSGDVTDTHIAWQVKGRSPEWTIPVIVGDLLFMINDKSGSVSCLEATSGEQIWRERLPAGGAYWASPLYADGKIYFSSKKGLVSVIAAKRELELLAENQFDGSFIASPAVAGDAIILRSLTHLYCIAK